jgi:UTP--glucose-1-phosphate uridylyltransferase
MQAIIPAAGLGTRLLPFSALASKEMAPIGTRPVIQWTLEEAAAVGISSAVVVLSPDKPTLRAFLEGDIHPAYHGLDGIEEWMELREHLNITIALQPKPKGLGDALLRGWRAGEDDEFYLMYPDNLVLNGPAVFQSIVQPFEQTGLSCVACKEDRPYFHGGNYLYLGDENGSAYHIRRATSRSDDPPAETDLAYRAAGRILVTNEYFDVMDRLGNEGVEGELDDIHAYRVLAGRDRLLGVPPASVIHDIGSSEGYKDAWLAYITGELEESPYHV